MIKNYNKNRFIRFISLGLTGFLLITSGLLAGCTPNGSEPVVNEEKEVVGENNKEIENEDKIMSEFNLLLENTNLDYLIKFIDENIKDVSKENASLMITNLENKQKESLSELEEKYFSKVEIQKEMAEAYLSDFDLASLNNIKDEEVKALIDETNEKGYKVETAEGMFYPVVNYEFYKTYSTYVLDDIKDYIDIMAEESNEAVAKDAALIISWDDVLNRALTQEQFLSKHEDSKRFEVIKQLNEKYIIYILFGLNNTPLFSYETKIMDENAKAAYLDVLNYKEDNEIVNIIKEYMKILKESDYTLTKKVDNFRKEIAGF